MGAVMSFHRCASLVLALAVSACASSAGTSIGGESETASATPRGNSRLIVRAQLERLAGRSAYEAVETLNRRWIQPQRSSSFVAGVSYARVVVDGVTRGELDELYRISSDNVETMRYLSAPDATTKYGTGYPGGVIEVTIRSGGR